MRTPEERQAEREAQAAQLAALGENQASYDSQGGLDAYLEAIRASASDAGAEFNNLGNAYKSGENIFEYVDPTNDWMANGNWTQHTGMMNTPEAARYTWAGFSAPEYEDAYRKSVSGQSLSDVEVRRLANPNAVGLVNTRPDIVAANPMGRETAEASFYGDYGWSPQQRSAIEQQWARTTPQAQDDGDGDMFGGMLGPLALMAGMYFLGPAAGALGEVGAASAVELAAADAAAGIGAFGEAFPAAITADIGAATAGNMGYDAAANLGEQAFQGPSLWDSAKGLYNQAKPALDAFGNIKKGVNLAQQLIGTGDAKNMNQSVSGLKQYQTQSQQGAPSRAFGLNNYNSVRG